MQTVVKAIDLTAYNRALRMNDAELVTAVRDLLGAKITAYICGVTSTNAVSQWADRVASNGGSDRRERLALAYRAAAVITATDSARVAQAWFQGMNRLLEDRAPARVLRESAPDGPDAARVLAAARAAIAP